MYIYRDTLHSRLNSHYEAWSYNRKKYKKIKSKEEPKGKRSLLTLDLKSPRSQAKENHSADREFQNLAMRRSC